MFPEDIFYLCRSVLLVNMALFYLFRTIAILEWLVWFVALSSYLYPFTVIEPVRSVRASPLI